MIEMRAGETPDDYVSFYIDEHLADHMVIGEVVFECAHGHIAEVACATLEKSIILCSIIVERTAQQLCIEAVETAHVQTHQVGDLLFGEQFGDIFFYALSGGHERGISRL